jgi:hypothetical protein
MALTSHWRDKNLIFEPQGLSAIMKSDSSVYAH